MIKYGASIRTVYSDNQLSLRTLWIKEWLKLFHLGTRHQWIRPLIYRLNLYTSPMCNYGCNPVFFVFFLFLHKLQTRAKHWPLYHIQFFFSFTNSLCNVLPCMLIFWCCFPQHKSVFCTLFTVQLTGGRLTEGHKLTASSFRGQITIDKTSSGIKNKELCNIVYTLWITKHNSI